MISKDRRGDRMKSIRSDKCGLSKWTIIGIVVVIIVVIAAIIIAYPGLLGGGGGGSGYP
jgi:hypothetical protein